MMTNEDILEQMYLQNRWPAAVTIEGEKQKRWSIVQKFITSVFCEQHHACGHCQACHLIASSSHPDVHLIKPEQDGHAIKIEQIRDLIDLCEHTPRFGVIQLVIIENADALNINAANALLKLLEEPSLQTHFILLVDNHRLLLPTIRSRSWLLSIEGRDEIPDLSEKLCKFTPLLMGFLQNQVPIADLLAILDGKNLDENLSMLQLLCWQMINEKTLGINSGDLNKLAYMAAAPIETWWAFYDTIIDFRRQNRLQGNLQASLVLSRLFLLLKGYY